jgi:hypothetical protein
MPHTVPGGGGGWSQLELTDALIGYEESVSCMYYIIYSDYNVDLLFPYLKRLGLELSNATVPMAKHDQI